MDLRCIVLKLKMEELIGSYGGYNTENEVQLDLSKGFSWFNIANLMLIVNNCYGDDIDDHIEIMKAIDSVFETNKHIIKYEFLFFILGFYLPFVLQLVYIFHPTGVLVLNIICVITQVSFLTNEILQFCRNSRNFKRDLWNVVDASLFILYIIYFAFRMNDPSFKMIDDSEEKGTGKLMAWDLVGIVLLINATIKLMFFSMIYEQYGIMVQMVIEVINKIKYFLAFLLYWCTVFSWLFKVAHIEIGTDDYPGVHPFIFYWLQIVRNTISDLATPSYSKWQ